MNRFPKLSFLILAFLSFVAVACSSGPTTVDGLWDEYVKAFKKYHRDLHDFSVKQWPEEKSSFDLQKKYQMARIKSRDHKFHFLREHYPDQVPTKHSIHDLIHFKWYDSWDTELYRARPSTQSLDNRVKKLKRQFKEDGQWSTLRERFQQLGRGSRYHEINRRYQDRLSELNDRLEFIRRRNHE